MAKASTIVTSYLQATHAAVAAEADKAKQQHGLDVQSFYQAIASADLVKLKVRHADNVGDRIFFESDSSELTSTAQATLDKQARWLQQYSQYSIQIEGHADERGTREYNFALGARRAQAVRDYLASKGIAAARLKTTSYGKERPVAVCDDISCWSQNRRGVTVLGGQSGN